MKKPDIKGAKWIVEFLEGDISIKSLIHDPDKAGMWANRLGKYFWHDMPDDDRRKLFLSDERIQKAKLFLKRPDKEDLVHQIIGLPVKHIVPIHKDLKPVWEEFKRNLIIKRKRNVLNSVLLPSVFKLDIQLTIPLEEEAIKLSPEGSQYFSSNCLNIFLSLLEGVPFSRIRQCKGCNRWFVSQYDGRNRKKIYCDRKCANRSNKRDLRTNPARKAEWEKVKQKQKLEYEREQAQRGQNP